MYELFTSGIYLPGISLDAVASGIRIEVGPGNQPFCADCDYVDLVNHLGAVGPRNRIFIANAKNLPFPDQSVSFIVTRGFPWFYLSRIPKRYLRNDLWISERNKIAEILREYKRVLTTGGIVTIWDGGSSAEDIQDHLSLHSQVAVDIGFEVIPTALLHFPTALERGYEGSFSEEHLDEVIDPSQRLAFETNFRAPRVASDRIIRERTFAQGGVIFTNSIR